MGKNQRYTTLLILTLAISFLILTYEMATQSTNNSITKNTQAANQKLAAFSDSSPQINLTPDNGHSATTITGARFQPDELIMIYWQDTAIPTIPYQVNADSNGNFAAIISVPIQSVNAAGTYTVKAVGACGIYAQATFTVVGSQDINGIFSWVLSLVALLITSVAAFVVFSIRRKIVA